MENKSGSENFTLNTGTDLAFALVVFISFFSAFSSAPVTSPFLILLIIILGIGYISNGIYGFSYVRRSTLPLVKTVYFVSQFLIGGLIIYFGKGAGFSPLVLLPLVAHAVISLDNNWSLLTNVGLLLTLVFSIWGYSHSLQEVWQELPLFFAGQVIVLIFTQMAVTEQKAREKLEVLAKELSEANKHLSEYAGQVHELAVAQERNRFAREIHDGLGHYLTTISMQLNASTALIATNPTKAGKMIEKARNLISEALVEVRNSVYALRKDAVELEDLPDRLKSLVDNTESMEMAANLLVKGKPYTISPQVNLTLYRTAQETLNNACKYSQATKIELVLDYTNPDFIQFTAYDNGIGAAEMNPGFGILGIQERVRLLNGEVKIENQPGSGFSVTIKLPVDK